MDGVTAFFFVFICAVWGLISLGQHIEEKRVWDACIKDMSVVMKDTQFECRPKGGMWHGHPVTFGQ